MKYKLLPVLILIFFITIGRAQQDNKELSSFFKTYSEESLKLFPFNATSIGDSCYNDLLFVDFTNSYRATLKEFYLHYLEASKNLIVQA